MKLITNKKEAHEAYLTIHSEHKDWHFGVKFDGCVHIERYVNGDTVDSLTDEANRDYLHICDLAEFIADLQEVQKMAKAHFGEKWPDC